MMPGNVKNEFWSQSYKLRIYNGVVVGMPEHFTSEKKF
jgi:hypothetical protein